MTQVKIVVGALEDFTGDIVKRLSVNATANLIENTPVDTGWARANWIPAVSAPFIGEFVEFEDEDEQRASVPGQRAAQQAGIASLLTYRVDLGPVFISNNVPYIVVLNEGSSKQAPAAFVQAAIKRAVADIQRTS